MKDYIVVLAAIIAISCTAQSPIKPLYNNRLDTNGAYYKDLTNDLNRFDGTWIYNDVDNTLTIILQKKEMQTREIGNMTIFQDILIGEYRYIENGEEKINTLSNLANNLSNPYMYNIAGSIIRKPIITNPAACSNCAPNDIKSHNKL